MDKKIIEKIVSSFESGDFDEPSEKEEGSEGAEEAKIIQEELKYDEKSIEESDLGNYGQDDEEGKT